MTQASLPVLFLSDLVVLPGMVVPIPLDEAAQSAVDAARASSDGELLLAPRLAHRHVRRIHLDQQPGGECDHLRR